MLAATLAAILAALIARRRTRDKLQPAYAPSNTTGYLCSPLPLHRASAHAVSRFRSGITCRSSPSCSFPGVCSLSSRPSSHSLSRSRFAASHARAPSLAITSLAALIFVGAMTTWDIHALPSALRAARSSLRPRPALRHPSRRRAHRRVHPHRRRQRRPPLGRPGLLARDQSRRLRSPAPFPTRRHHRELRHAAAGRADRQRHRPTSSSTQPRRTRASSSSICATTRTGRSCAMARSSPNISSATTACSPSRCPPGPLHHRHPLAPHAATSFSAIS